MRYIALIVIHSRSGACGAKSRISAVFGTDPVDRAKVLDQVIGSGDRVAFADAVYDWESIDGNIVPCILRGVIVVGKARAANGNDAAKGVDIAVIFQRNGTGVINGAGRCARYSIIRYRADMTVISDRIRRGTCRDRVVVDRADIGLHPGIVIRDFADVLRGRPAGSAAVIPVCLAGRIRADFVDYGIQLACRNAAVPNSIDAAGVADGIVLRVGKSNVVDKVYRCWILRTAVGVLPFVERDVCVCTVVFRCVYVIACSDTAVGIEDQRVVRAAARGFTGRR